MRVLIVNFELVNMTDAELRQIADELAPAFRGVAGLERKYWLADEATNTYGGAYIFESHEAVEAYLASDIVAGIKSNPHFTNVSIREFGILEGPTALTMPALTAAA